MKFISKKILLFSSLSTLLFSQAAFAMGAKKPQVPSASTTIQTTSPVLNTVVSNAGNLLPLFWNVQNTNGASSALGRALPLIENLLPLFSTISPLAGKIIPVLATISSISHTRAQAQLPSTYPTGTAGGPYMDHIIQLAEASSCADYVWKNGQKAPAGFVKGIALSFGRSICRQNKSLGQTLNRSGSNPLRATYVLGMGAGMLENGGVFCGGWNQVSSSSVVKNFLGKLLSEYQSGDQGRCLTQIFQEGTTCGASNSNISYDKNCPAFGVEAAMTLLRTKSVAFASINNKEAEVVPACDDLLKDVQSMIEQDPENACGDIL